MTHITLGNLLVNPRLSWAIGQYMIVYPKSDCEMDRNPTPQQ